MSTWSFQDSEWRQGVGIPHNLLPGGILPPGLGPDAKLIIVTHDCDIVNPSYEAEPWVEFIIARPLPDNRKDGRLFRAKNPRRLQFWARQGDRVQLFEASIHDKFRIERPLLENHHADTSVRLSAGDVRTLASWSARRYDRSSFPTEFNNRAKPVAKQITKALERDGDDVRIFMGMTSFDDLPANEDYSVTIRVVAPPEALQDDAREQRALKVVVALQENLSRCPGIKLIDVKLESSAEFSLDDVDHTIEWDLYDYLSMSGDEP